MAAPATAAEALTGLARIRPAGWLATPMPTDEQTLLARARRALDADHPGVAGTLRLVAARYTAAVFTVHTPTGPQILKLHADPGAFAGESLAYDLLADAASVARLHSEGEASSSLLLEYLPQAAAWSSPETVTALAECVAAVHTASLRLDVAAVEAMAPFGTGRQLHGPAPYWITDTAAWGEVLAMYQDAYGPGLVPLGHLDLKPEHLRRRDTGELVLLDVETVRPDVTGLIDLVTLPAVYRQAGHDLSPARVLDVYLEAACARGASWTAVSLKEALRAFATATGLRGLHGLDT
ncbi:hypothetical protein ABZW30_42405 [Kitasatospora sp. NPDC004669]|uniref:hypothetical protein n=1 Tax=Kitasatospora sp. NPDC004669 TaxID=3154555 RepID=UPI00339E740D